MSQGNWKENERLKGGLDKYVKENLKRSEILDFVERD